MPSTATSETATTDALLEHSRLVVSQNLRHLPDLPGVPPEIVEQVQQLICLIDAAKRAAEVVVDNSWEGMPLPYPICSNVMREINTVSLIFSGSLIKERS